MTPKQEQFCQEYLIDLNAAAAARRAGYSEDSAKEYACDLMREDHIKARIEELLTARSLKVGVNSEFVLNELLSLARVGEGMPKVRALELLGKHLHMFNDKIDVNITLAKKAEEFQKLSKEQQLELMKLEIKRLESGNDND
jgi:hypothetical protein